MGARKRAHRKMFSPGLSRAKVRDFERNFMGLCQNSHLWRNCRPKFTTPIHQNYEWAICRLTSKHLVGMYSKEIFKVGLINIQTRAYRYHESCIE